MTGAIAAAIPSYVIMGWAGVTDFEGERAMTSAFAWGRSAAGSALAWTSGWH